MERGETHGTHRPELGQNRILTQGIRGALTARTNHWANWL